ncbi:serine hydrolase [Acetobacterium sp.]|jgi:CubicO group peptidase (beta-lactamase class C family)|uniref:serine hydrolase domain-containing protein n=1 Tax=Acetobacterium sp. TaxID=1872094 RepID=UPI002717F5EF|nr:serine hydrolase [Acetobacterium sp.]MDO9490868.1 serine hydrolase [Acetobacterium sp.]
MNQKKIKAFEKMISSDYPDIAGIVVQKSGNKLYENYFNGYAADHSIHVYSVTKSIVSGLIGIALDKGQIKSVDQKVLDFFPDYAVQAGEKTIQEVTIKNLLTMTAPYKYQLEPYEAFFASENWVKAALDLLGGEQIGEFKYSPIIGAHILSGILVKATGQPIIEFAIKNLFSPLGINGMHNVVLRSEEEQMAFYAKEKHTNGWVVDPQGINTASWGLTLTPVDMAKIGQLYLNGGLWEGKQIISKQWIDISTQEHIRWDSLSYGYLWWIIDEKEQSYAALGDGGNVIYVNTKKNMVITIASLLIPEVKDRVELILKMIEPLFSD